MEKKSSPKREAKMQTQAPSYGSSSSPTKISQRELSPNTIVFALIAISAKKSETYKMKIMEN